MDAIEATFQTLLVTGILALWAGLGLTRQHWRPGVAPFGRNTPFLDVALHPERYVKDAPVRTIRSLNLLGGLLLAGAGIVTVYEVLRKTVER